MNEITVTEGLEIAHENGIQCLVFAIRQVLCTCAAFYVQIILSKIVCLICIYNMLCCKKILSSINFLNTTFVYSVCYRKIIFNVYHICTPS